MNDTYEMPFADQMHLVPASVDQEPRHQTHLYMPAYIRQYLIE